MITPCCVFCIRPALIKFWELAGRREAMLCEELVIHTGWARGHHAEKVRTRVECVRDQLQNTRTLGRSFIHT